ncbi:Ldh family oxidoreductase [Paracoccus onubensis]|uniref:Oxidoreductase n=1 Tax=Paracoccus onubensis TaxID=1675788 RepID=A0A418T857_9RHOB|nr:Ldh family oxidoreductase [Paracoccus onubensis]RJE89382.1 oxidoreductase [Paracoccus onubensis]
MMNSKTYERITRQRAADLAAAILTKAGFSAAHVSVMAQNMLDAQAQECHSHGLYRLITCSDMAATGLVNLTAEPKLTDHAPAIVKADAQGGNSLLAFDTALDMLTGKASDSGIAALAINNCFHYSALWWEVEQLSKRGFVALAMTPTHPYVAPFGGKEPLFGTNPLAFSWPRPEGEPYTFDFATSAAARGEVEIRSRRGESLPAGWAIDKDGNPTTESERALSGALLPFGGHKGSAISTMIELMAGPLIGDMLSSQTSAPGMNSDKGILHGELVIVFDPKRFGISPDSAETLFRQITDQGARLPSQRRRAARLQSEKDGLLVSSELLADLNRMA